MVDLTNRQRKVRLPMARLEHFAKRLMTLLHLGRAAACFVFVDNPTIRRTNRKYLGRNGPTDVLAFSQLEEGVKKPKQSVFLGDVMISVDQARIQAKAFRTSLMYELCLYMAHGLLHLVGYKDHSLRRRLQMQKKEKEILKKLGVK